MNIREITDQDFDGLMKLYTLLHANPVPVRTPQLEALWQRILNDPDHHIIVAEADGMLASSCVCVIIPNLTRDQRPYALIENVVTDVCHRRQGLATACLNYAREIARAAHCYKMMLLTGAKDDDTLHFYTRAGYNRHDKTGFIQWL